MKWFNVFLAVVFAVSYLGITDSYAQPPGPPPEMEELEEEEPGVFPELLPEEEYEPWMPPGPEPGPTPGPTPETGEGPPVNPESWEIPAGARMQKPAGEEQFAPGIAAPSGAPPEEALAVGAALLYVQWYGNTRAATWVCSNLTLLIMGQGNITVKEYVWYPGMGWRFHQQAYTYNPGPSRWSRMWFHGDIRGWHALQAYVDGVPSNWVYTYVR